ncbi:MAG TPA: DUF2911 domain-containing protein [Candidatus Acidoferrum sp.]|nr:DUF2911 domain-containing protein [Candidatus Acidoferrum sp.]
MGRRILGVWYFAFAGLILLSSPVRAQFGGPPASPAAKAECKFADGKTIHIDYSSPRMRGRKIFGDLVPYGEPWRAGANEATTFVIDADVSIGDKTIPKGSYTLFALPNPDAWTLIISKQTGEWGIPYPGQEYDLARVPMKVSKLAAPIENFTIAFEQTGGICTLRLEWETTRATVDISQKK